MEVLKGLVCFLALCAVVQAETGLANEIGRMAPAAHGKVGVACSVSGANLDCAYHARDRFPMQSVYKLPIAMAMLDAVEHHAFSLDQGVRFLPSDQISPDQHSPLRDAHPSANVDVPLRELLRLAVSESDGTASDILLRLLGGPPKVDAYVQHLGIAGIKIADTEKTLGRDISMQYRNYAEPAAAVSLLTRLFNNSPLSYQNTRRLLQWMTDSPTGAHRIRALLPSGTAIAHKTGTSGTNAPPPNVTNDVGIITLPDGRRLFIAIFVCDSRESEGTRELVIAKIARLVWDKLSVAGS